MPQPTDVEHFYGCDATPFKDAAGRRLNGFAAMPHGLRVLQQQNNRVAWLSSDGGTPYSPDADEPGVQWTTTSPTKADLL